MDKAFFTYDEQLSKLISDGLFIASPEDAKAVLEENGYFRFIKGYNKLFLLNEKAHSSSERPAENANRKRKYISGARFEDIKALYDFDNELRSIVFKRISAVETKFKSIISYEFSRAHGVDHKEYLNTESFQVGEKNKENIDELISKCLNTINESCDSTSKNYRAYIAYQNNTYGKVPVWTLFMSLTFGTISKFYQYMHREERLAIAERFAVTDSQLDNILRVLVKFRNIVSHNERLFDVKLYKERLSPNLRVARSLSIPKNKNGYNKYGLNDFLALLIVFKYTLAELEFATLICDLEMAYSVLEKKVGSKCANTVKSKMAILHVNLSVLTKIKK